MANWVKSIFSKKSISNERMGSLQNLLRMIILTPILDRSFLDIFWYFE